MPVHGVAFDAGGVRDALGVVDHLEAGGSEQSFDVGALPEHEQTCALHAE